jgi:DNA-binding NtrC family response regulator
MHILVVDDEDSVLMTVGANLELAGYRVTECNDPTQAVEIVSKGGIDLVLSDIRMPGMNGVEMFHAMRRIEPTIPVVLMTAFAHESLVDEAIQCGVFTVLAKPFAIDHLIATIAIAGKRPAILVVDGREGESNVILSALMSIGLRCRIVADGASALVAIETDEVDICLVETGSTTVELVHEIRRLDPGVTFIALASDDRADLVRELLREGIEDCVMRPVYPPAVVSLLARTRGRTDVAPLQGRRR